MEGDETKIELYMNEKKHALLNGKETEVVEIDGQFSGHKIVTGQNGILDLHQAVLENTDEE